MLEGYRNPAKDRLTDRPFELAVLRSAIPAAEWNTLDDVNASKIPVDDAGKPWVWLQKNQGALCWRKHLDAGSIPLLDENVTSTPNLYFRVGNRSTYRRRTLFFRCKRRRIHERQVSFRRFREDIFYRDGQRKPEDPPFTLAFVVSQAISFEAAQHTNTLLASSTIEEQMNKG